jgi:hypothetical protein
MTDDPPLRRPNRPWRDLLVALAIPYFVVAIYAAIQFSSLQPLVSTLMLVLLMPLTLFLLGAQMSPLALVAMALLAAGAVALALPMRSLLRVPILMALVVGLYWITASTGVFTG